MRIEIYLQETAQRIVFENATNAYTKGPLYCVYLKDENRVYKYPVQNLFNVKETYADGKKPLEESPQRDTDEERVRDEDRRVPRWEED